MSGAAERSPHPATYADLEALPPHVIGELVGGELLASPRPGPLHALASSGLGVLLGGPFQHGVGGPGGWWILDAPELHLHDDVLVPDLAGWRLETLPALPESAWFEDAPDWICEVLSPSTERIDRLKKLAIYAREGVAHVWLLDPALRTLEVYRLQGQTWSLLGVHGGDDDPVRAEPFEVVELVLGLLWSSPEPG